MRAIHTTDFFEIWQWCWEYMHSGHHTTNEPVRRFTIGFYQIAQGIDWEDSDSAHESWSAAALHFMMAARLMDLDLTFHCNEPDISLWDTHPTSYKYLLRDLSLAARMVVYFTNPGSIKRKSRYDPDLTSQKMYNLVKFCFDRPPKQKRQNAIIVAMEIMCGEL